MNKTNCIEEKTRDSLQNLDLVGAIRHLWDEPIITKRMGISGKVSVPLNVKGKHGANAFKVESLAVRFYRICGEEVEQRAQNMDDNDSPDFLVVGKQKYFLLKGRESVIFFPGMKIREGDAQYGNPRVILQDPETQSRYPG